MLYVNADPARACWHCVSYGGMDNGAAVCLCPTCSRLRSQPELGCASFQREIGADDCAADGEDSAS